MVACDDSYRAPRIVLIDFGLATMFSTLELNFSGTPGYMPPETYQAGLWSPQGDIYSMGIVFFQVMVGHIPTKNGTQGPVLAPTAANNTLALTHQAVHVPLPWARFPQDMPELRDLVESMTAKSREQRPRAPQALAHEWFGSESNADLPEETIRRLIGASANNFDQDGLVEQLETAGNLDHLRAVREQFRRKDSGNRGRVTPAVFVELLTGAGVRAGDATAFASYNASAEGLCPYDSLLREVIDLKEEYNRQLMHEVLVEVGLDGCTHLTPEQLDKLLSHNAFEIPRDEVRLLAAGMAYDASGRVSIEEFRRVIMKDGRIGRRSDVDHDRELDEPGFPGFPGFCLLDDARSGRCEECMLL